MPSGLEQGVAIGDCVGNVLVGETCVGKLGLGIGCRLDLGAKKFLRELVS